MRALHSTVEVFDFLPQVGKLVDERIRKDGLPAVARVRRARRRTDVVFRYRLIATSHLTAVASLVSSRDPKSVVR